jgi:hypothetical protein
MFDQITSKIIINSETCTPELIVSLPIELLQDKFTLSSNPDQLKIDLVDAIISKLTAGTTNV